MSFVRNGARHRVMGIGLAALALSALAIAAMALPGTGKPTANAQEVVDSCVSERYTLCISKRTIGGNGTFDFDVVTLEEDFGAPCLGSSVVVDSDHAILSNGESFSVLFKCAVRVTERPQPGWQLINVDCDFNEEIWDISPIPNGILVVYNPSTFDSESVGQIDCTFVNALVRQPLNLGGLFAGQPTPLPTAPAPAAPAATAPVISPPRTGDAGLK